jgi:hypothetical protein
LLRVDERLDHAVLIGEHTNLMVGENHRGTGLVGERRCVAITYREGSESA